MKETVVISAEKNMGVIKISEISTLKGLVAAEEF